MDRGIAREGAEVYFNDQYFYAAYSNKNIDIYSTKFVNLIQILDTSGHDVVCIRSSFLKPSLFVLTRKEVLVYSPYYSIYGTINFSLIRREHLGEEYTHMEVADRGDYIVLTREGCCKVLKINWNTRYSEEPQHIDDMPKLAILRFPEAIIKSDLSNDSLFWATQGNDENKVFVWDFQSVIEAGGSLKSDKSLKNFCLTHETKIEHFEFRKSKNLTRDRDSRVPNIIICIDREGNLYIWCENS